MLICTRRWKEFGSGSFIYRVLDTDDMVEEDYDKSVVSTGLKSGLSILGLKLISGDELQVDEKYMNSKTERKWQGLVDFYSLVSYIDYTVKDGLVVLDCPCETDDFSKELYFIKDGRRVASTGAVPRKDPVHGSSLIDYKVDSISQHRGSYTISLVASYFDKSSGMEFTKHMAVNDKDGVVKESKWFTK